MDASLTSEQLIERVNQRSTAAIMADDPLLGVFGPAANADPLAHVFGTPPMEEFGKDYVAPPPGPLVSAAEGRSVAETGAAEAHGKAIKATAAATIAASPEPSIARYLGHGFESGLYSLGSIAGDAAESFNPVSAARDLWLNIEDEAHQIATTAHGIATGNRREALVGDPDSYLRKQAKLDASTPFTRFAERMQRQSNALGQTPDGQKYNELVYATTDPSKSALLSPVRVVHDALQSLPATAAMATTVYLTRGAALKAYGEALAAGYTEAEATAIATKAAGRVATLYGAAGEGTIGGFQQGEQTRVQVLDGKNPEKSPIYQAMVKAGVSPGDAKQYIATEAGSTAGIAAGAVDALTNALEGPVLGHIISEGGPLASRVLKGTAAEGIQEGVQGAGEQVGQNFSEKMYVNPQQTLADSVAENVIASFAVGGLTGGTFAGAGGNAIGAHAPPGLREAGALDVEITPQDEASPLPTDLITAGKMTMGAAEGTTRANQMLRAHGMPDVGTRVTVSHAGRAQKGAIADVWTVDVAGQTQTGVKIRMDDGTMIEEPLATLQDMGVQIAPEGLPEGDLEDPVVRQFAAEGMANVRAGEPGNASPNMRENMPVGEIPLTVPHGAKVGTNGAHLPMDVVQGLIARGIPEHVARGAAAGVQAEAEATIQRSIRRRARPASASGSAAQGRAHRRYGPNPTRAAADRIPRLRAQGRRCWRRGGLAAKDEAGALDAYIRDFMRPKAGAETDGDLKRGRAALGVGGVQRDLFGGEEVSGAQMDARRAVERASEDKDIDKEELTSTAQAVLDSQAAGDEQYVEYHGNKLGRILGTSVSKDEAPDYAREARRRSRSRPTRSRSRPRRRRKPATTRRATSACTASTSPSRRRRAIRSGTAPDGSKWSVKMPDHYGYVKRTTGADGEQVDVYVGPRPESERVFVIDQHDADTGKFDEHKAMLGYDSGAEATKAYDAAFDDGKGPQRRAHIREMSAAEFKDWLGQEQTRPVAETEWWLGIPRDRRPPASRRHAALPCQRACS
jgi:hypothetical protein